LQRDLPASDRTKLGEYLDDVREIERRIQKAENQVPLDLKLPKLRGRAGILRRAFQDHVRLAGAGVPRRDYPRRDHDVRARYQRALYPQSGIRDGFHVASHHSNNRANMDKFALINKYHVEMLAYFLTS
jgi:hypothetical protein